uniref:Uncharacterized protein n=1 Tax=Aegilops tauschii subsp. strangulata TaxID=200361 RepID=A0A453MWS7_AEGTS
EKGTMIRVYIVAQATKSHRFQWGAYASTIYSLSFGLCIAQPDAFSATSSSGSLHTFFLDAARNGRLHFLLSSNSSTTCVDIFFMCFSFQETDE